MHLEYVNTPNSDYTLECEYANEPCSKVLEPPDERASIALIKYAQAHAWLKKRNTVDIDDIIWAAPYVLAHRIELTPSSKSKVPNPWDFLKNTILTLKETKIGSLEKPNSWLKAIAIACKILYGEPHIPIKDPHTIDIINSGSIYSLLKELEKMALGEFGRGDLVIRELFNYVKNKLEFVLSNRINELKIRLDELRHKPNLTYSDIAQYLKQIQDLPSDISAQLINEVYKILDNFRILINLEAFETLEDLKKLLILLDIDPEHASRVLDKKSSYDMEISNDKVYIKRLGKTLIITAQTEHIANEIRRAINKKEKHDIS